MAAGYYFFIAERWEYMVEIIGGNLFQWDIGRQVKMNKTLTINEAHFARPNDEEALVVEAKEADDNITVDVPNILLQTTDNIIMYAVKDDKTIAAFTFTVTKREKPADYVYTETEVRSYEELKIRIEKLEENNGGADLAEYVKITDIATGSKLGLVMVHANYGININANGLLIISPASAQQIDARANDTKPITPRYVDYAVKKALADCKLTGSDVWNEQEKKAARDMLGVTEIVEDLKKRLGIT